MSVYFTTDEHGNEVRIKSPGSAPHVSVVTLGHPVQDSVFIQPGDSRVHIDMQLTPAKAREMGEWLILYANEAEGDG